MMRLIPTPATIALLMCSPGMLRDEEQPKEADQEPVRVPSGEPVNKPTAPEPQLLNPWPTVESIALLACSHKPLRSPYDKAHGHGKRAQRAAQKPWARGRR